MLDNEPSQTSFTRIMLKISGEALMGDQGYGINPPTIENTDKGLVIKSKDTGTSIGYRKKGDNKWNIYTTDSKINYANETEIIMFKPGYELFYKLID